MIKLKAIFISMALTLSISLCQTEAFAYPAKPGIRLRILLTNTVPMPPIVAVEVVKEALTQIRSETKARVSLEKVIVLNDPNPQRTINLHERYVELKTWRKFFGTKKVMTLVITSPLNLDGGTAMGGMANSICDPKGLAIVNFKLFLASGESALLLDISLVKHELGHLLGANHSGKGVMKFDALTLGPGVPYSQKSKREIRRCQNATM